MLKGISDESYSRSSIQNALLNWQELEGSRSELLRIIKCDIEMAISRLDRKHRIIINTLILEGDGAILCKAVSREEVAFVVADLYEILNVKGLG